ncbi:hypothetical protein F441_16150 [Phytophthora nicotianae CJ01A1]|uniref:RxLR effector PexRD54 WY domain-containing protein n=6 Tax=Phytophthora nicotianae TaxID=4792 RepID=W2PR21_PHYN3|nr:hypothetical protein PPTG_16361 [Phytophthora nicotianae INRA-310]ETI37802.1 hypothetical protein F443_16329 [Phytophthora nicotianae P1569]ETK72384.1 hypothetical protein L915_20512 [Phytophthora nicotianae]ETO66571.1 hypothetical protein F444_16320 [Phytophthora nicotianae P1976]ETP07697.1 hypothetical protein F441_16150 [Phytophthora nicotianae CJ01A1]ETL25841.1 hypothetical protein L916_20373 [Phytophthora nicotianae]
MVGSSSQNVAKRVEGELFKKWHLSKSNTSKDIFQNLRLYAASETLLYNPSFKTWMRYATEYGKPNPHSQTSMIGALLWYYGENLLLQMIKTAKNNTSTEKVAADLQSVLHILFTN